MSCTENLLRHHLLRTIHEGTNVIECYFLFYNYYQMLFKGPIERTFYYGKYLKSSIIFIQPCITKKI
jgi:hypothetical protein